MVRIAVEFIATSATDGIAYSIAEGARLIARCTFSFRAESIALDDAVAVAASRIQPPVKKGYSS